MDDWVMEQVFVLAATIVQAIGLLPALIFVGFLPWYLGAFYIRSRSVGISAIKMVAAGSVALALGLVMSSVLVISAMMLGQWG